MKKFLYVVVGIFLLVLGGVSLLLMVAKKKGIKEAEVIITLPPLEKKKRKKATFYDKEKIKEEIQRKIENQTQKTNAKKNITKEESSPKEGKLVWEAKDLKTPLFKARLKKTEQIRQGKRVEIELLENALIQGVMWPEGTTFLGIAVFKGNRCHIRITAAYVDQEDTVPINLKVVDIDMLDGIYCEELEGKIYDLLEREAVNSVLSSVDNKLIQKITGQLYNTYRGGKYAKKVIIGKSRKFYLKIMYDEKS